MKDFFATGAALTLVLGFLFLAVILSTLVGALTGWIVGWFFSETILTFFAGLGITGLKMWQLGAALGFVGGFFKAHQTNHGK